MRRPCAYTIVVEDVTDIVTVSQSVCCSHGMVLPGACGGRVCNAGAWETPSTWLEGNHFISALCRAAAQNTAGNSSSASSKKPSFIFKVSFKPPLPPTHRDFQFSPQLLEEKEHTTHRFFHIPLTEMLVLIQTSKSRVEKQQGPAPVDVSRNLWPRCCGFAWCLVSSLR